MPNMFTADSVPTASRNVKPWVATLAAQLIDFQSDDVIGLEPDNGEKKSAVANGARKAVQLSGRSDLKVIRRGETTYIKIAS